MMRRCLVLSSLALCAAIGARPATAAPISFTGQVEQDFNPATNPGVVVTPGLSDPYNQIYQAPFIINNHWITGWAVKDVRLSYDAPTDTLSVGVNTFVNGNGVRTIAGDAYGSGIEADPTLESLAKGTNPTQFGAGVAGNDKSITIVFAASNPSDPNSAGTPVVVAGIPADKTHPGPGTDGFNVASYTNSNGGIQYSYGQTLSKYLGGLAFDPSAAKPGFEFTIKNFSTLPGLDRNQGFWITTYAGSGKDGAVGETQLAYTRVPALAEQNNPEPTTVLGWSLVAGAGAWSIRRRRGQV